MFTFYMMLGDTSHLRCCVHRYSVSLNQTNARDYNSLWKSDNRPRFFTAADTRKVHWTEDDARLSIFRMCLGAVGLFIRPKLIFEEGS